MSYFWIPYKIHDHDFITEDRKILSHFGYQPHHLQNTNPEHEYDNAWIASQESDDLSQNATPIQNLIKQLKNGTYGPKQDIDTEQETCTIELYHLQLDPIILTNWAGNYEIITAPKTALRLNLLTTEP
jgi:hypothetical protein